MSAASSLELDLSSTLICSYIIAQLVKESMPNNL